MISVDIFKELHCFNLDICFSLEKEVVVIQGPSGSGKTTIFDCITGIKTPDKGKIQLDDTVVFSHSEKINLPIKDRKIGYVFQNYALFPHMNVKENIIFGMKCSGVRDAEYSEHIIEALKLKHLEKRFPRDISGGEKQRVAFARSLAVRPKLMLLDEPFSALDYKTKDIVYKEFLQYKKMWDVSIILVTHDKDEAQLLGDRILNIKEGVFIIKQK